MAFVVRTRDAIRADYLAAWATRFAASGRVLATLPGTPAYMEADALATAVAPIEAQAAAISTEMLPSTAVAYLDAHAAVYGLSRRAASPATLTLTVTGPAAGAIAVPANSTLTTADGLVFTALGTSVTLTGGGPATGTLTAICATAGTVGNKASTTVLTWSSAPAGLNPTAAVVGAPAIPGLDPEDSVALRVRLLLFLRDRPGAGDRADWASWLGVYTGVYGAYVYERYDITYGPQTPGAVLAIVVGPPPGDSPVNSRLYGGVSGAVLTAIQDYVDGTRDRNGAAVTGGSQLRPVTTLGRRIQAHEVPAATDVTLALALASTTPYPWTGTQAVNAGSTTTSLRLVGDTRAVTLGVAASPDSKAARIPVGTANARGGFQIRQLGAGDFSSGVYTAYTITALAAAPTVAGQVYPAPPNDDAIRAAVFAYFDQLAPGDTAPASRWPGTDLNAYDTLYRSALASAVIANAAGVIDCAVAAPAVNVTPAARSITTLGVLILQ